MRCTALQKYTFTFSQTADKRENYALTPTLLWWDVLSCGIFPPGIQVDEILVSWVFT